jgi:hypothetical protein
MTTEETNCFVLLDEYARTRHRCFVTEFFLSAIQIEYVLCFRPTGVSVQSPNYRYACRYFYIDTAVARMAGRNKKLPESITELLDKELPKLAQT